MEIKRNCIRIRTELSACPIFRMWHIGITYTFCPHKHEQYQDEVPLNMTKCLFFRNVWGHWRREKSYWFIYFGRLIFNIILKILPLPLYIQIPNEKTIWRKSLWHCLGKGLDNVRQCCSCQWMWRFNSLKFVPLQQSWKRLAWLLKKKYTWRNLLWLETYWRTFGIRNWKYSFRGHHGTYIFTFVIFVQNSFPLTMLGILFLLIFPS